VDGLVAEHGSLAAVAWKLVERTGGDAASAERALRRLRGRGQQDGGACGARVLRAFGVPAGVEARVRWMGLYHSPFQDLPIDLCVDQLRVWDRPPVSDSRARVWLALGFASVALRRRDWDGAAACLARASASPGRDAAAELELLFAGAYLRSKRGEPDGLEQADAMLAGELDAGDRVCFFARLVDHRGYRLNRGGAHGEALALYRTIPDEPHPFAAYRKAAGVAYGLWKTGDRDGALASARAACDRAGDGGYVRLRAMGLLLAWKIAGDEDARARAEAIARRLGDDELLARSSRPRP
jgi:hypothetical protein